jgi:hypothetical protein
MRRERRNHAIARKCPRAGIDTEALPSSTNGPRTRAGRLAGWRRHATGCDGRGAATQEKEAQSGRTRAPSLALFLYASRPSLKTSKSSQVRIRVVLSVRSEDTLRGPEPSATLAGAPPAMRARARSTSPSHSHFIDCGGAGPPDSPVTVLSGWSRCASPRSFVLTFTPHQRSQRTAVT